MRALVSIVLALVFAIVVGGTAARTQQPQSAQQNELESYIKRYNEFFSAGRYELALAEAQKLASLVRARYGSEHETYADAVALQGRVLFRLARYSEAERLYAIALPILERGKPSSKLAYALDGLGMAYHAQARYVEAEALYRRALNVLEQVFWPNHPETANLIRRLADVEQAQGKYLEAEGFNRRALAIYEQSFGPEHPEIANTLSGLGETYAMEGKLQAAEAAFQRALAVHEKVLGPFDPTIPVTANNLGMVYQAQGRYSDAEALYKRALQERGLAFLRPESVVAAQIQNNLASLYEAQGRIEDAEQLYEHALTIPRPANNDVLVASLSRLGDVYRAQGKYADAQQAYQSALDRKGQSDPRAAAQILNKLALAREGQGAYSDAEDILERVVRLLGSDHPDLGLALDRLASIYQADGKQAEADRVRSLRANASAATQSDVIERYPSIDAPDRIAAGETANVLVSLTVRNTTVAVEIGAHASGVTRTASGALALRMPESGIRVPLSVVLCAPGFEFATPDEGAIELDRTGDSTVARFRIMAPPGTLGQHALRVTFWKDGEFLASASRTVEVIEAPRVASPRQNLTSPSSAAPNQQQRRFFEPVPFVAQRRSIDLTVEMVYDDPRNPADGWATVSSPHFPHAMRDRFTGSPDLADWIDKFYREFRSEAPVGQVSGNPSADAAAWREARLDRMRGFGAALYRRAAPAVFKQALAKLLGDQTVALRTIQIYSNSPLVPWELMQAPKPDGSFTDFFGIAFALARGHEEDEQLTVRPLQDQRVDEVVTIAPAYVQEKSLSLPSHEVEQIRTVLTTRQIAGTRSDLISVIRQPPAGIVHFAGHGEVQGQKPVERRFAILLEDGLFDVMDWRGLPAGSNRGRALYFFNACDIGQAESVAGAVEGWGPAVLAKGASGYIGGLWPLKDAPAARFAVTFYQKISQHLRQNQPALVADALAQARRLVYETGDATYLAYAFYGDAQLQFVPAH